MGSIRRLLARLFLCSFVFAPGCGGDSATPPAAPARTPTSATICQAGLNCCTADEIVCSGDPDSAITCTCDDAWTCEGSPHPRKCWQQPPTFPDGKSSWRCIIAGTSEQCAREGKDLPAAKNGWSCFHAGEQVACLRPTHTPGGGGHWACSYANEMKTCTWVLEDQDAGPSSLVDGSSPPRLDGSSPPRLDGSSPPRFDGSSPPRLDGSSPSRLDGSSPSRLDGGASETAPVVVDTGIVPPPPTECIPGQKMWCDGTTYCGWGQTICGPDGTWARKRDSQTGELILDCTELPDGRRPNTTCACYYRYWNRECCERPDCIVPAGTNGRICGPSSGEYCAYCNPAAPECKGPEAKCIVTTSNESFCGQACFGPGSCPTGSDCRSVEAGGERSLQCVPRDLSCFH